MGGDEADAESHALRGAIDRGALTDFRDVFERQEPLATGRLDDPLDPSVLRIDLDEGVGSAAFARLDVVWTTRDDYSIHYTDPSGRDVRWDRHRNDFPRVPGDRHFHPPPDASSDVRPSCIAVAEIELVARAAVKCWREAYETGSLDTINELRDPP